MHRRNCTHLTSFFPPPLPSSKSNENIHALSAATASLQSSSQYLLTNKSSLMAFQWAWSNNTQALFHGLEGPTMGLSSPHNPISCPSAPRSQHLCSSTCQASSSLRTFIHATAPGKDRSVYQHHLPGGALCRLLQFRVPPTIV